MQITKVSIVNGALSLLRISGLTKNPTPEDIKGGIQVADDYAAELKVHGLDLKWNQPAEYGTSDANDTSGLTVQTVGPFKKLLVAELCGYYGKDIPASVAYTASRGMRALEQILVTVPDAQNPPTLPFGSGNEQDYRDRKFYNEPVNNDDAIYVYKDNILNFDHDFSQWLNGETIVAAVWATQDNGITIASESNTDTIASAELTFVKAGGYEITITATKTGSTDSLTFVQNFVIEDPIRSVLLP